MLRHGWIEVQVDGRPMRARVAAPSGSAASGDADPPPVVLVHGLAVSSAYFVPLLERLGATRRTLAPDLPGHGRSTARDHGPPALGTLVDQLEAWSDAVGGLAGATLVGNSLGGQVVVELAARRPDLAGALVLLGPTTDRSARSMPRHALRLARDVFREPAPLVALEALEYLRAGPRRAVLEFRAGRDHDLAEALAASRIPLLLARGARDPIATRAWLAELGAARPDADHAEIPGAAHAAHWSHAAAVAALVDARRG